MRKNPNIVVRTVPPAVFRVVKTKCYNSSDESMLEIDEIGHAIWNCMVGSRSRKEIISDFLKLLTDEKTPEFIETVTADVNAFLDILVDHNCAEEE